MTPRRARHRARLAFARWLTEARLARSLLIGARDRQSLVATPFRHRHRGHARTISAIRARRRPIPNCFEYLAGEFVPQRLEQQSDCTE